MKRQEADAIIEKLEETLHPDYIIDDDILIVNMRTFVNSLVSESVGCPMCQNAEGQARWENMLKEYERFMIETKAEIANRLVGEFGEWFYKECETVQGGHPHLSDFIEWLEKREEG